MKRDWTVSDQADEADAKRDREWWKRSAFTEDYPDPDDDTADGSSRKELP